eukprot:795506-Lingulodinium_polyedra.AAC.1
MSWPRVGHALAMHWSWIGHGLAMDWPWIGHELATNWPCIGQFDSIGSVFRLVRSASFVCRGVGQACNV